MCFIMTTRATLIGFLAAVRRSNRKEDRESAALSQLTVYPNPSSVRFGHHFAESQPQSGRVLVSFMTALRLTKFLEDPGAVFFWYAWTIIRY